MHNVGSPAQFSNSFDDSTYKKYRPLVVINEINTRFITNQGFALEKIVVIDKINLHTSRLDGSNFDNQRMIVVVNDQVHARQPDYFV